MALEEGLLQDLELDVAVLGHLHDVVQRVVFRELEPQVGQHDVVRAD